MASRKRKPMAVQHRSNAERAAEWALKEHWACVSTRRAIRPAGGGARPSTDGKKVWGGWGQKVDFFAADVMGKRFDGSCVYAQATAAQSEYAVRQRRRKLEAFPWHESETVVLLNLREEPDPRHASRKLFFFRVHEFDHQMFAAGTGAHGLAWSGRDELMPVPRDWFKALHWDEDEDDEEEDDGLPADFVPAF